MPAQDTDQGRPPRRLARIPGRGKIVQPGSVPWLCREERAVNLMQLILGGLERLLPATVRRQLAPAESPRQIGTHPAVLGAAENGGHQIIEGSVSHECAAI